MEIANLESSKFQVLSAPVQTPGVCSGCGSSSVEDRKYVDMAFTLDFYGVVYICTFCFTQVCNQLGFLNPEQTIKLETELEAARNHIFEFRAKEKALDDAISTLRNSGLLAFSAYPEPSRILSSNTVNDKDITRDNTGTKKLNSDTKQPDKKSRSNDVPAVASDDFSNFDL